MTHSQMTYIVLKEKEMVKQTPLKTTTEIGQSDLNKNIWEEPKGKYEGEKEFVGGTLNQIIRHLTSVVGQ